MKFDWFSAATVITAVSALRIDNIGSIKKQLQARSAVPQGSIMDDVFPALSLKEKDWVLGGLSKLNQFNGTSCQKCHYKMKLAKKMIDEKPEMTHLTSVMLYEYCLSQNKNSDKACEFVDFFITTNTKDSSVPDSPVWSEGWYEGETSVDFFDNDFINLVKNMNMSSNLTLNYYCYYKGSYCPLPKTPSISDIYNMDALWPNKTAKQMSEPAYNSSSRELFNVLHVSDFHNELRYEIGAEANCSQGLCCLPESFNTDLLPVDYNFTSVYKAAGASSNMSFSFYPDARYFVNGTYSSGKYADLPLYRGWNWAQTPASTFGNYQCDPPEVLLNNSLANIGLSASDKNFEFSLFTGDIVDHDVLHCDANTTKYAEIRSYNIMKHYLKGMPVFPTLGNHDTFPYGQLAPQKVNNVTFNNSIYHWNDELMADLWTSNGWLDQSMKDSIAKHYSAFSVTTKRGLKVISLNSNCYYQKNLYAYIDMENQPDIFGQWDFLIKELVDSESKGQRVWILAHIPSGDYDTLPIQSNIFAKIVERFSPYTIANIFYGHTHKDQFKVLFGEKLKAPVNMAWISQAITPLGPANPSWRYYQVEDQSFNIINAYNYFTPLNETWVNGGQEPKWSFEYSPRDAYDPKGEWPKNAPLNATFWNNFVLQKLGNLSDVDFNQKYTNYLYRNNPYVPKCKNGTNVSSKCYSNNYCYNAAFRADEVKLC